MRTKQVTINEKIITVKEKRVSELKAIMNSMFGEADKVMAAKDFSDVGGLVNTVLADKLTQIIPELTPEDIDNAYPSELEEAVAAFIEVNFQGVKKVAAPLLTVIKNTPAKQQ